MKTFKEYRDTKSQTPESMETCFGSHSLPNTRSRNSMETSFGSHSSIDEDSGILKDQATVKPHLYTVAQNTHIHDKVAPLDDDNLSAKEVESIEDYADDSKPVNSMLHQHDKGHDINVKSKEAYKKTVGYLDNALRRRNTTEDMHVFTGMKTSPAKYFKKVGGNIPENQNVHLPAFTSTSTSIKAARGFAEPTQHPYDERHGITYPDDGEVRHILKIHVPKGSHGMSIRGRSFAPEEDEILLARGHNINIHHKPEHISADTFLWHGTITSHEPSDLSKSKE